MTHSDVEAPKGAVPANDNFQELSGSLSVGQQRKLPPFQRDFSCLTGPTGPKQDGHRPSMVSGTVTVQHSQQAVASHLSAVLRDPFANWTGKSKIGRRKVTRSLTLHQVKDLQSGWHHANKIGLPFNRFLTFRPNDIDDQSPEQRIRTWTIWRNKLAQFARDHDFVFTCLWTRESQRSTGLHEHMHVLMNVPRHLLPRFGKVVKGWRNLTDEIDVRPCTYQTKTNRKGGSSNILTYVTKNSPQAGRFLQRIIQLGGPIFGKRFGLSRNVDARARARADVGGGLRRDLRLPSRGVAQPSHFGGDEPAPPNRRQAA